MDIAGLNATLDSVLHEIGEQAFRDGDALPIVILPSVKMVATAAGIDTDAMQEKVIAGWLAAAEEAAQRDLAALAVQPEYLQYQNGRIV